MQQRIIGFIVFLLSLSMVFYFFVIDEQKEAKMKDLADSDIELVGDVTSTVEVYERLEKKWIGTSKHVQQLQEQLNSQIERYDAKMDSIGDQFLRVENSIQNTKELLLKKIDNVGASLDELKSLFNSYKRSTNRKIDDIEISRLPKIETELKGVSDSLAVVLDLESIRKDIEKLKKQQAAANQ